MKVIVLINSLYTGGAEFSTLSFYQWFRAQGNEVSVVCVKQARPSFDPAQFGFNDVRYLSGNTLLKKLYSFHDLVNSIQPHLVHSVLFEANLIGRMARMYLRNFIHMESLVNEMYSPHRLNDPHVTKFKLNGYRLLDKFTQGRGVDHFHATSNSASEHYQQQLAVKPHRISVVMRGRSHNPYVGDKEFRRSYRASLGISEEEKVIIIVARQEFQKGYEVLLKSLSGLLIQKDWVCLCVGRDGNMTVDLVEMTSKLRLSERIRWMGHRNDVMQLLALSDIFVFPSRFEGLPGVLIEAEAAGLPIVCSDINNNKEVVWENENALLFPVNNEKVMMKQLGRLLTDMQLCQKMGAMSRRIFEEKFIMEKSHQRLESLIKDLLSKAEKGLQ